jgi:hypothetical protein
VTENIAGQRDVFAQRKFGGRLVGLLFFIACQQIVSCKCQDDSVLALAEEVTGAVERDFAQSLNQWTEAKVKAEFRVGDGVQSKVGGGAILSLTNGAYVKLKEKSRIRFLALKASNKKTDAGIDVETGEVELTAGAEGLSLETADGALDLQNGSRVRIRRGDKSLDILVDIGKAVFIDKTKKMEEIAAGQGISLLIGSAVIERLSSLETAPSTLKDGADSEAALHTDPAESTSADDKRGEAGPPRIPEETGAPDLSISVGESTTVHVGEPPSTIAVNFNNVCPKEGAVQAGGKWLSKGSGTAIVRLKAGRHPYRIFCLNDRGFPSTEDVGKGRVTVVADSGRKRLPKDAPSSTIDVDGRRYNILYQTKLPQVTVRWPEAPLGQTYTLHITSSGKTKSMSTPKPELRLSSGDLKEGLHRLKFEAKGKLSRTSRVTEVQIGYDNAAPVVGILSPSEKGFGVGDTVEIAGESAPGWTASVPGGNLSVDAQNRFKGSILFQGPSRGIAIRLSHPSRGVHYYIRRGRTP